MATVTIQVQSLLNAATYDSYTVADTTTIGTLKTSIQTATGVAAAWYVLYYGGAVLNNANTLASYGIATGSQLRSANRIGHLSTFEDRQKAKLDLAALDRSASGNARATVDITTLPTQFDGNSITNNPNAGGLVEGRPWIETVSTFTFYEAFGTTSAISTTQYVSGNKIYVYSSSFDVPAYQNARVVVNDVEVLNIGDRGHNMVVLDSNGNLLSTANYDTYGVPADVTALASALSVVSSGNIVVLTVWDASAVDAAVRSAINTGYGSTNSNTWTASRVDHIFIGIKA